MAPRVPDKISGQLVPAESSWLAAVRKGERHSLISRFQLEAAGLRVRGVISGLVDGEKDDTDVTGQYKRGTTR